VRLIDRNAQTNRWRRIPAVDKAAFAIGMMVVCLLSGWPAEVAVIALMLGSLVAGARVPLRDVWSCATIPLGFIAASSVAQMVTLHFHGGVPLFGIAPDELLPAGRVALRSFACLSALIWLALTTPLTDIVQLLRRMGVGAEISDIALMMFRFIWLTLDCVESGVQSQANRLGYATYRGGLRSMGMLLASLLPRVLSRARRLEAGLAARGYSGELRFVELQRAVSRPRQALIFSLLAGVALLGRVVH
jgi:cobalt/nickel transport system permease protein